MRQSQQALILAMAASLCLATLPLHAEQPANPLVGKWAHVSENITLTIDAHRLHAVYEYDQSFSLHADYALRHDHVVFGLFTRVESSRPQPPEDVRGVLDTPFCCRVRLEDGCLVIFDVKTGKHAGKCHCLEGVYKPMSPVTDAKKGAAESTRQFSPEPAAPSCVLAGNRVVSFALFDLDGKKWEYPRQAHGRLTLLSFWYSTCPPCLQSLPHLRELHRDYAAYGLNVVSIACEKGSLADQRSRLRAISSRYRINYPILLSGDGHGSRPIENQFEVTYFPLLVLLDQSGTILWRSAPEGMDDAAWQVLRKKINDRLISQTTP